MGLSESMWVTWEQGMSALVGTTATFTDLITQARRASTGGTLCRG